MIRVVALAVLCSLAALNGYSEERLADQRTIIFDRLSPEDGLSQGIVTAVVQDSDGFLWIGTQEGLNRYDGESFLKFYHDESDPNSLVHDHIRGLHVDSRHRLWVATDSGINRFSFSTQDFERFSLSENTEPVYSIAETHSGVIIVGSALGLYYFDETRSEFVSYVDELIDTSVRSLAVSGSQDLLVGTETNGLYFISAETRSLERFPVSIPGRDVRDILEDSAGRLWVGTFNSGLSIYSPKSGELKHFEFGVKRDSLSSNRIRSLLEDHEANIWIGTDNGLHLYKENGDFTRYRHDLSNPRSISDNTILELYQDRGGVVWIGTYYGVSKWNAKVELFPYFRRPANTVIGSESNNITAFEEGPDGNVWIGTLSGLMEWDHSSGVLIPHEIEATGLIDSRVMSLRRNGNELWAGTMTQGIHVIKDGLVEKIYRHEPDTDSSLSSNAITKMYRDQAGDMWIATYGGGVNRYLGGGRFKRYPDPLLAIGSFPDLRSLDIVEVREGEMWIATQGGGVVILDSETGETTTLSHDPSDKSSIPSNEVLSLLPDEDGVWIGTVNRGLAFYSFETRKVSRYSRRTDGLASDAVYGLLKDSEDRIWLSGGKGLSVLDTETNSFRLFDSSHGLQSSDFNSGAYAALSDGSFLFGGNNGFNAFYPEKITINGHVPPVHITEVQLFNEPISLPDKESDLLELQHSDSVISFAFAALDFTTPARNQYRYKLEGFDTDWRDADGGKKVTYTNLDAGRYTFTVIGSNNDGVWNEEGASLSFLVLPAPWLTWWAYSAYLGGFLLLMYVAINANLRRLRREAERKYSERLQLYIESLEEASDGIMIADVDGKLLYANHTTSEGIGKSRDEISGASLYEVLFDSESDRDHARHSLQNEGRYHGEVAFEQGQNDSIIHEVTIAAVQQASKSELAYVGISRDVTARKATDAQLESYRRNLEDLVEKRTQALQREVAENKAIQVHLANSLQEKELLLKEVHHRVKNNMQVISSLLSIQSEGVADETYSNLLNESQQRIKSMALIHETLYQSKDLLEIDFQEYIETLSTSLSRSYRVPGVEVQVLVNVENVSLDLDTAVPCGLIINELVSNSLKHAFAGTNIGKGTITVDFIATGCGYELKIADNGVGLPESFDPSRNASMGMEIVSILTSQLEGTLSFRNEHGATFEIKFPRLLEHA